MKKKLHGCDVWLTLGCHKLEGKRENDQTILSVEIKERNNVLFWPTRLHMKGIYLTAAKSKHHDMDMVFWYG